MFADPRVRESFRNYFWTAQLCAGLAMSARGIIEGASEGFWMAIGFAVGGFIFTLPVAAVIALIQVAAFRSQLRQQQRLNDQK
jgi:Na+-driven multidrug efflux pump